MLKRINYILIAMIIVVNLYTIVMPVAPIVSFWLNSHISDKAKTLSIRIKTPDIPVPKDNRLIIPKMQLDEPIYDGESIYTVNKGIWRRPGSSTPERGNNTVMVGHRFTYQGAAVFYHLDLISVGDEMAVYWQGQKYNYKVKQVKEVPPTDIGVESATATPTLTIYTCTPVWTAKNRLVIVAERTI